MRRAGNLWTEICAPENLRHAFLRAARGKHYRPAVQRFATDVEGNLGSMRKDLVAGSYRLGTFHRFTVFDPKERVIHAAGFPERVLHHAVIGVCEPWFERRLIHHCYACRRGKGQYVALEAAQRFARGNQWYLKLDIRKFFDSIPHEKLAVLVRRIFKDRHLLEFFDRLLDSYQASNGRGLPIGSLTSQHLANAYLGELDRRIEAAAETRGYLRYMDDFVAWSGCRSLCRVLRDRITGWVENDLGLELKHSGEIQQSRRGMNFLGYRVFPGRIFLNRRSRVRFVRKNRTLAQAATGGAYEEDDVAEDLLPLTAFAEKADDLRWRRDAIRRIWTTTDGLEPRQPRRQLEQQCAELPHREPQQQLAGQPQQQPRLPSCPQLRSGRAEERYPEN